MDMFALHFDSDSELHEAIIEFKHDIYESDPELCQIFAACKFSYQVWFIESLHLGAYLH